MTPDRAPAPAPAPDQRPRAQPRQKIFHPTELRRSPGGPGQRAHLIDLSTSGAQVHSASVPVAGERVFLGDGDHARFATVAWVRGNRFGVRFVLPLTEAGLAAFLATQPRVARGGVAAG